MTIHQQLVTVLASTASIISVQLLGVSNPPQSYSGSHSKNLGIITSIVTNLPANAASNSVNVPLGDKNLIISQATRRSRMRYVPPTNSSPRRSQGSGSRGDCQQSSVAQEDLVTLLIPSKNYAGKTISSHPTFFWHVSQPVSVPMRFTLTQPGVTKPLYQTTIDSPKPGIVRVEIPKNRPELVSGQTYRWSVSLECNSKRPSLNPLFYSWIERVPPTPALEQQLAAHSSNNSSASKSLHERALIYAEAGLWYDAIAAISSAQTANPNDSALKADYQALLNQVGLNEVARR